MKRLLEWIVGMEIVRVGFDTHDCWIGSFYRDYRRPKPDAAVPVNFFKSDFGKDLVSDVIATDIWFCFPIFCKIQFRIKHCELTEKELAWMNDEGDVIR